MAIFFRKEEMGFEDHPKFKGVRIAKLVTKAEGQTIGVSMLQIGKGVEIPVHVHDESLDSIYCKGGAGEIFRDGGWHPLSEGDYCLVPAGQEHGVRAGSDRPLELFVVHSPPLF